MSYVAQGANAIESGARRGEAQPHTARRSGSARRGVCVAHRWGGGRKEPGGRKNGKSGERAQAVSKQSSRCPQASTVSR